MAVVPYFTWPQTEMISRAVLWSTWRGSVSAECAPLCHGWEGSSRIRRNFGSIFCSATIHRGSNSTPRTEPALLINLSSLWHLMLLHQRPQHRRWPPQTHQQHCAADVERLVQLCKYTVVLGNVYIHPRYGSIHSCWKWIIKCVGFFKIIQWCSIYICTTLGSSCFYTSTVQE